MYNEEIDATSLSVPKGRYATHKQVKFGEVLQSGTLGDASSTGRQLRIEADEETPPTCKFIIDVKQEEERKLFGVINRRLKRLRQ